jgi:hypothetical protein
MSYVNNFYVRSVSGVGFLPCDDEPIREVYQPKKDPKKSKLSPPLPPQTI